MPLPEDQRTLSGISVYSKRHRERDLIESDEILDNEALDDLWGWFNKALDAEFDRELIFVKMVNLTRKPYKERLKRVDRKSDNIVTTPELHPPFLRDPEWQDTPGTTDYAQSEAPVSENRDDESTHACSTIPPPVVVIPRVALMAARAGGVSLRKFVEINSATLIPRSGSDTTEDCSGTLSVSSRISPNTLFELQFFEDNTCAFKSSVHENVYLRASTGDDPLKNGSSLLSRWFGGMGSVNAVKGLSGDTELFKIHRVGAQSAEVVIESIRLPGKFLRSYPGVTKSAAVVNLQDGHGVAERFLLVISPP